MKNLIFFFTLLLGVMVSGDLSAQSSSGKVSLTRMRTSISFKSKEVMIQNASDKVRLLSQELLTMSNDAFAEKQKQTEVALYKQFLSDLNGGVAPSKAYDDNVKLFETTYTSSPAWTSRKLAIVREFNNLILN
jgi:hypothetical protein